MRIVALAALLFVGIAQGFGQAVPPDFLGVHTNHVGNDTQSSWPIQVPASIYRTLSTTGTGGGILWFQIQTDPTTFNFALIDRAMKYTSPQKVKVTYTPQGTPSFAVGYDGSKLPIGWSLDGSQRRTCACADPAYTPDHCYPPGDINPDGSGTDAAWIGYITALATHVHALHVADPPGYSDISYWENGNEWTYNGNQFCASFAQMARMLTDEKCVVTGTGPGCTKQPINASAKMMTIALTGGLDLLDKEYLATVPNIPEGQTPAQLADVFNYHCYTDYPNAEGQIAHGMSTVTNAALRGMAGKPVICTEGGWADAKNGNHEPPDTWPHAADFTARLLLGLASTGIHSFITFGYDFYSKVDAPGGLMQLQDIDTTHGCVVPTANGFLCTTGVAWTRIAAWLKDVNFAGPCSSTVSGTGHIWTCSHSNTGGDYQSGQFAWFDAIDEIAFYQVPSGFTRQEDMGGVITTVVRDQSIPLSNSPVLLMDDPAPLPPTDLTTVVH